MRKFILFWCFSGLLFPTLASASEDAMARLEEAARDPAFAADSYWLEMLNIASEWEKVILIFGYVDDYSACRSIAEFAAAQNLDRQYRCVSVNGQ